MKSGMYGPGPDHYWVMPLGPTAVRVIYRVPWDDLRNPSQRYLRQLRQRCLLLAAGQLGCKPGGLTVKYEETLQELYAEYNEQALMIDYTLQELDG